MQVVHALRNIVHDLGIRNTFDEWIWLVNLELHHCEYCIVSSYSEVAGIFPINYAADRAGLMLIDASERLRNADRLSVERLSM
jgi:hypothetical protein